MDIAVLVKAVPSATETPALTDDNRLRRDGENVLDPGDEYGVEVALQIVEAGGGTVTYVTMGPESATAALRKALAMGGDGSVHVADPALAGADALVTARVLAAALGRRSFDLIVAGVESTDGYTGTVPTAVAELLGIPSVSFARKVELAHGRVHVQRQTAAGYDAIECELPALVTVTTAAAEPRYPTLKGIMQAKQKPLEVLSLADLGIEAGAAAATQRVETVQAAPERAAGEIVVDDGSGAERIAGFLADAGVI
jgi:electron transfer flavoprotein beta subunit